MGELPGKLLCRHGEHFTAAVDAVHMVIHNCSALLAADSLNLTIHVCVHMSIQFYDAIRDGMACLGSPRAVPEKMARWQ
jgi:hypothetical protein